MCLFRAYFSDMIPTQKGFPAYGGYYREEAILALRRFYITANANGKSDLTRCQHGRTEPQLWFHLAAPKPRNKGKRVLKTEFLPIKPGAGPPSSAL